MKAEHRSKGKGSEREARGQNAEKREEKTEEAREWNRSSARTEQDNREDDAGEARGRIERSVSTKS